MAQNYIRRYATPIWQYLKRDDITEVAVNPDGRVWIETTSNRYMMQTDDRMDENAVKQFTGQLAGEQSTQSGRGHLMTSAMLTVDEVEYPLRVQCVLPPACLGGGSITVRKFAKSFVQAQDIQILKDACSEKSDWMEAISSTFDQAGSFETIAELIIRHRLNVVVSGGTSSGKTTVLKSLLAKVDPNERVITIEDVPELMPKLANYVGLIADRDSDVRGPKQLLASVLRMRPDRFLVGELRGDEARVFLEAINTGHDGSMTSLHANSAEKAINRLVLMALGASENLSARTVVTNICDTIDLVLQTGQTDQGRGLIGWYVPSEHVSELRDKF